MFFMFFMAFSFRVNLSVAIVAMTERNSENSDFEVRILKCINVHLNKKYWWNPFQNVTFLDVLLCNFGAFWFLFGQQCDYLKAPKHFHCGLPLKILQRETLNGCEGLEKGLSI